MKQMKITCGVFSGGNAVILPPPHKIYKELQRFLTLNLL
nr:MAG TPA: hypothetical protein [Caudoviricetes sp.]DAW08774.1 MAG TPA: hypothetical protein [Caudoviricetes sp.]